MPNNFLFGRMDATRAENRYKFKTRQKTGVVLTTAGKIEKIKEELEIAALESGEQTELKIPYQSWKIPYSTHGTHRNTGRDFEQDDLEASKLD